MTVNPMQTEKQLDPKEVDLPEAEDIQEIDDDLAQPQRSLWRQWRGRLILLLILVAVGGGGYYAYSQLTAPAGNQQARRRDRTVTLKRANLPIIVTANGTIQPEKSINVSPKSSGRLKSLLVKEGQSVTAGQILAYMDESNTLGSITQADGNLAAAEAMLKGAA